MATALEVAKAQVALAEDNETERVFRFILEKAAAPGWRIVKALGHDTESTEASLDKLLTLGLLEGDARGLDGSYHATSLGYEVKEAISY